MIGQWFGRARTHQRGHAQVVVDVDYLEDGNEFEVKVSVYPELDALTVASLLQRAARDVGKQVVS